MRANRHGIRHLKSYTRKGVTYFYWHPPAFVRNSNLFKMENLGVDREHAICRTQVLNVELENYRESLTGAQPRLKTIRPMTAAWLAREFEASARFGRYADATRSTYSRCFRRIEAWYVKDNVLFGDLPVGDVSHQVAFRIYESHSSSRKGAGNGNKIVDAWSAAFRYGCLAVEGISLNPFLKVEQLHPPARRQRWSDEQFDRFIEAAGARGHQSIQLYALLCMELAQRPCDVLNLKWKDYQEADGYVRIRQTKQLVEVRVPPTRRLKRALKAAKRIAEQHSGDKIADQFICPTISGKRWHRRNVARLVRQIARSIGIPDDLQVRDLRRTAATEAASAGVTMWEMMSAGGWQNPASVQPYLVWTPEQAASFQAKREAYRLKKRKTGASSRRCN